MSDLRSFSYIVIFIMAFVFGNSWSGGNLAVAVGVAVAAVYLMTLAMRSVDREEQRKRDQAYIESGMAEVDLMAGLEFEKYIAARLRQSGWRVSMTAATGDYGVDLIASKDGQCMAVQCKRYGKPVGVSAVQQVVSGASHHSCTSSMVISNQEFTKAAVQLAKTHKCKLVGRSKLPNWSP